MSPTDGAFRQQSFFEITQQQYEKLIAIKEKTGESVSQLISRRLKDFALEPEPLPAENRVKIKVFFTSSDRKEAGRIARERNASVAAIVRAIIKDEVEKP